MTCVEHWLERGEYYASSDKNKERHKTVTWEWHVGNVINVAWTKWNNHYLNHT